MPITYPPLASQSNSASGGMVPTYIGPTETFTVPANRQALKAMIIVNEGFFILESNAFLIEVN